MGETLARFEFVHVADDGKATGAPGATPGSASGGFAPVRMARANRVRAGKARPTKKPTTLGGRIRAAMLGRAGKAKGAAGAAGKAAAAAGGLGRLALAAGAAGAAIYVAENSIKYVADQIRAHGERIRTLREQLAPFNAALASANARAQAQQLNQTIRSGQFLGDYLARQTDAQNRLAIANEKLANLQTRDVLRVKNFTDEFRAGIAEWKADFAANAIALRDTMIKVASGQVAVADASKALEEEIKKNRQANDNSKKGDFLSIFLDMPDLDVNDPIGDDVRGRRPGGDPLGQPVNAPGFGPTPRMN